MFSNALKCIGNQKYGCVISKDIFTRYLTTTEVAAALRPFYFSVHPDLFGQHPSQRSTNENSLKQLSSYIATVQSRKRTAPCNLEFYLRDKKNESSTFRLVKIHLNMNDIRKVVLTVLKCCALPTEYVDKIPQPVQHMKAYRVITDDIDFNDLENDPSFSMSSFNSKIKEAKDEFRLKIWIERNYEVAQKLTAAHQPLREELIKLKKSFLDRLGILDIHWDCGWNERHFMGCLQSLKDMTEQYPNEMTILRGRTLVFAPFTGVSLDGHIMLYNGEVRHNWLDSIKKIKTYDETLQRIPAFEKAVSQVLLNIQVVRRKFMPKIEAANYERNLQQLTTNINNYLSRKSYPSEWPPTLKVYEIVVENEAGPLMVSPTGQFITPCTCPGVLLVKFITENLTEAAIRIDNYKRDKYVERSLHQQCIDELHLPVLHKDDNVTPDLMIHCCNQLLKFKDDLEYLKGLHLNITTYYSVLTDGTVCIPWNWTL